LRVIKKTYYISYNFQTNYFSRILATFVKIIIMID
jgi:hypothetical protein